MAETVMEPKAPATRRWRQILRRANKPSIRIPGLLLIGQIVARLALPSDGLCMAGVRYCPAATDSAAFTVVVGLAIAIVPIGSSYLWWFLAERKSQPSKSQIFLAASLAIGTLLASSFLIGVFVHH